MADEIKFVSNYNDLSTDKGFQFEFYCDRCQTGYRTKFKTSATGLASEILDTAGSILGGIFGSSANVGRRLHSANWQRARDEALQEATLEILPQFVQCPRCSSWFCRDKCWNTKKGLCKNCAPDMGVEMSAAQASRSVEEIWAHASMAEEDKKLSKDNWRENIRASCPNCETPLAENAKFCPNCGEKLRQEIFCPECGNKVQLKAKFCPDCGNKL